MVGKLIKHELHSTLRVAMIPAIIMVLLAVLARIMIYTTNTGLVVVIIMFYVFAVMATLFIGYFFGVGSFYKSLFTGNGYLTLSLPVTADQLIWSKLISAITVMFGSLILCGLSSCIFFIGLSKEILDVIYTIFATVGESIEMIVKAEPGIVVEAVVVMILAVPLSFLVFYAVMSLGQLFTIKSRKAISILMYIGLMFVWSTLSQTIFADIAERMTEISPHLTMGVSIAFYAGVDVGCYFLVRYIIKNRINLLA